MEAAVDGEVIGLLQYFWLCKLFIFVEGVAGI